MKKEDTAALNQYRAIINSKEIDMLHLGNKLHENVAQELYAIRLLLQRFILINGKIEEIDTIKKMLNGIISEVQQIANHLLPTVLRDLGFTRAVDDLIVQSKSKSIKFNISIDAKIEGLSICFQNNVYQIIKEFLINIAYYQEISEINLKVKLYDSLVVIETRDNRLKGNSIDLQINNELVKIIKNSILYYDGLVDIQNHRNGMKLIITLKTEISNDKDNTC